MSEKSLLDQWHAIAYDEKKSRDQLEKFWSVYFNIEKNIYAQLLEDPDTEVKGTVRELAEKYGQDVMTMTGFLDGINDSLKTPNPIETMTEDTEVSLAFDKEKLYKNMVDAKADWLYELPQWRESLTKRQEKGFTVNRKSPVLSARERRSAEMTRVHAEAGKSIKSAAEEMPK